MTFRFSVFPSLMKLKTNEIIRKVPSSEGSLVCHSERTSKLCVTAFAIKIPCLYPLFLFFVLAVASPKVTMSRETRENVFFYGGVPKDGNVP